MVTFNKIIKEIKRVPVERLEELHEYVHSLTVNNYTLIKERNQISFSEILRGMSEEDYRDFVNQTKKVRTKTK